MGGVQSLFLQNGWEMVIGVLHDRSEIFGLCHTTCHTEEVSHKGTKEDTKARNKILCLRLCFVPLCETLFLLSGHRRVPQTEAPQFSIQRGSIVVEYLRGLFDVAAGALERLRDRLALDVVLS